MIGARPHDWEAKRDIDPLVEIERFQWDQRLVVIHGQRRVVGLPGTRRKQRIGGMRASDRNSSIAKQGHRRFDNVQLLGSELAAFASMRIEPANGDARIGDAEVSGQSIGNDASSGCFRMLNENVIDLYSRVPIGTRVTVL